MKFDAKHVHLLNQINGKDSTRTVEVAGVVYLITSLRSKDDSWVNSKIDPQNPYTSGKEVIKRTVAAGVVGMKTPDSDKFTTKEDLFPLPEGAYGEMLKENSNELNNFYNEHMLEAIVQSMQVAVVRYLHSEIDKLNKEVSKSIEDSISFSEAQDI